MKMNFRKAVADDIPGMHKVRLSVKENVLNNPALVTLSDYAQFISTNGKGWVCETGNEIVGFAIIDCDTRNVWALFVDPGYEKSGIAKGCIR